MNNLQFTVASNKRVTWSDRFRAVRFITGPDPENTAGSLKLVMPVEQAEQYRVGERYFLQLWPVPVAEQNHTAPAGSSESNPEQKGHP